MAGGASLLSLVLLAAPAPAGTAPPRARAATPVASPAAAASVEPGPSPSPGAKGPVILFLIDNSASLPPLDPQEKRVEALEKMFTFLRGQPYRLVLFGGRHEIFVDDPSRYNNKGLWTDFYFAFDKAREIAAEYPKGTDFRMVFITDAIPDPGPTDWTDMDVPAGAALKPYMSDPPVPLTRAMKMPLNVTPLASP